MKKEKKSLLLKVVYFLGEKSVNSKCSWWYNQPKVPQKLKKNS